MNYWNNAIKEFNSFYSCKTLALSPNSSNNLVFWVIYTQFQVIQIYGRFWTLILWFCNVAHIGERVVEKYLGWPQALLTVSVTRFLYFSILWTTYS